MLSPPLFAGLCEIWKREAYKVVKPTFGNGLLRPLSTSRTIRS